MLVPRPLYPSSFTRDGQLAAVHDSEGTLYRVTFEGGNARSVEPLFRMPHKEGQQYGEAWPEISPDGQWLAYASDGSGQPEVYVRPFPGPGQPGKMSLDGGWNPAWHPKGGQLFFVSRLNPAGRRRLMVVDFAPG